MRRTVMSTLLVVAAGSATAQQPAAPAADPAPAPKAERRICKQSAEIGSLIPRRRECHTRAEWDRIAQAARSTGQTMQDQSRMGGAPQ